MWMKILDSSFKKILKFFKLIIYRLSYKAKDFCLLIIGGRNNVKDDNAKKPQEKCEERIST